MKQLAPLFNSLSEGLSSITGTLLDAYNTYIMPVLYGLQQKIGVLIDEYIQPTIDKALELIGKIADAVKDIWEIDVSTIYQLVYNECGSHHCRKSG